VITDVSGIDKEFDYLVAARSTAAANVGAQVRVELHGRRVGGWIAAVGVDPPDGLALRELAKIRGWGPEKDVVELAGWAAWRWASRRGAFLTAASPERAVSRLPAPRLGPPAAPGPGWAEDFTSSLQPGTQVVQMAPAADPTPLVAAVAQRGPTLVVLPTASRAAVLAGRLARAGAGVALLPGEWDQARAGCGVVIGTRGAAWGPCPGLAAAVVIDAHDEGLTQEGVPTWNAVAVVGERARRSGAPVLMVTPCPTPELLALGPEVVAEAGRRREGWAQLEVLDRRGDDPRLGFYSERLVNVLRSTRRVVCVLNRKGRARLLACASCGELARCERCGSAVSQSADGGLECRRCGLVRPEVCTVCTSSVLRRLKVGVTRAREELELLAGRDVGEVTSSTVEMPGTDVLIGTEAVLHRLSPADRFEVVAFVDFDHELLAPRFRAPVEALSLLALASRIVGGRSGTVAVQTRQPDHPTIRSALLADPGILSDSEVPLRRSLRLPPYTAIALVSGEGAAEYMAAMAERDVELLGPRDGEWMLKASDATALADVLTAVRRPAARLRVAVEPARL
jgi:primosomal protein N' (replication factor Y)